jgi:hypothetical protein
MEVSKQARNVPNLLILGPRHGPLKTNLRGSPNQNCNLEKEHKNAKKKNVEEAGHNLQNRKRWPKVEDPAKEVTYEALSCQTEEEIF